MGVALLLLLRGESQNLHVITRDTPAEEPSLSPTSWLPIYSAFSNTCQPRGEGFTTASRRWESRLIAGSLPAWEGTDHSLLCGIWLVQSGYCLQVPVSLGCLGGQASVGAFCLRPLPISRLLASSAPSLGSTRQNENPGKEPLCHSSGPVVPGQTALFSPPFRAFLVCFIATVQG